MWNTSLVASVPAGVFSRRNLSPRCDVVDPHGGGFSEVDTEVEAADSSHLVQVFFKCVHFNAT